MRPQPRTVALALVTAHFLKSNPNLPCPGSFKASYEKHGHKFTFLAVQHAQDHPGQSTSILSDIKKQIENQQPDSVLIETSGRVPSEAIKQIPQECYQHEVFRCSESEYAAIEGDRIGASVFGSET